MRASPRLVVVAAVVVACFLPAPVWAQQADAVLVPVESGRLDALTAADVVEERELCLPGGMYVLAFARGRYPHSGYALVEHEEHEGATVALFSTLDEQMGWDTFSVEDGGTCFQFVVFHGRARVYELRVGVAW